MTRIGNETDLYGTHAQDDVSLNPQWLALLAGLAILGQGVLLAISGRIVMVALRIRTILTDRSSEAVV